jgi:hypothetical protein
VLGDSSHPQWCSATTRATLPDILNKKVYETGEEVGDQEMDLLNIRRHKTLPDWNSTIRPYTRKQVAKM